MPTILSRLRGLRAPTAGDEPLRLADGSGGGGGGGALPLTTKGDVLGYDSAPDRIPVGADGYVLTANSGSALGLSWVAPAAPPAALQVDDGTHTVTSVTDISVSGGTVSGGGGHATITVAGGVSGAASLARGGAFTGNGSVLTTAVDDIQIVMPIAGIITQVILLTKGGTGSCVVDILKGAYSAYPTNASITGSSPPTITAGTHYEDSTLAGWSPVVAVDDILTLHLVSTSTFKVIGVTLCITAAVNPVARGGTFSGNGSALTPSVSDIEVVMPVGGTISKVVLLTQGGTGSCVVNVLKGAYSAYPANASITGSSPPSITAGIKYEDSALTGWTTAVATDDILTLHLVSTSVFKVIQVVFYIRVGASTGGGGASLELTDGTTDLTGVSKITVSGLTVGGTSSAATLTASGGGGGAALPGTILDLALWWESDDILVSSGTPISRLRERTPWITGILGAATAPATIDATPLNALPILQWGASGSPYTLGYPVATPIGFTAFFVCRATSSGQRALFGGATNSLALYLDPPSTSKQLTLFNSGVAVLGAATTAWTAGTAFQANVTYNPTSGAYAFRQAQAANGSGTASTGIGTGTLNWIGADYAVAVSNLENCSVAAIIIYNRVLTSTEITNVENYLHSKWNV